MNFPKIYLILFFVFAISTFHGQVNQTLDTVLTINGKQISIILRQDFFELYIKDSDEINTYFGEYRQLGDSLFLFKNNSYIITSKAQCSFSRDINYIGDNVGIGTTFSWVPWENTERVISYDSICYVVNNRDFLISSNLENHEVMIDRKANEELWISIFTPIGKVFDQKISLPKNMNFINVQVSLKLNIEEFSIDLKTLFNDPILVNGNYLKLIVVEF